MAAKNPRVSTVVDKGLLAWLTARARAEGLSLSMAVRDILARVREDEEEELWARAGEERLASFVRDRAVKHEDAWK